MAHEQFDLSGEFGWGHKEREHDPYPPPIDTVEFVVRGLKVSMSHANLDRDKAIDMFLSWYPEAEILPLPED